MTRMKKIHVIALLSLAGFWLTGCEPDVVDDPTGTTTTTPTTIPDNDPDTTQTFTDGLTIVWDGSNATVEGNVEGVTLTSNENGYVVVTSTVKGIKYALSGSGTGQFKLYSDYKYELLFNGLTLTCSNGAPVNSQCKKAGYIVLSGTNVLTDSKTYASSDEDQKAAFFSEGQLIFSGEGTLTVHGNYKHALASDDYIRIKEGVLNLNATASDGMHANDGIYIEGGTITVNAAGEGIQCDTAVTSISGGTISVTAGDKGILSYDSIRISGGEVVVHSTDKGIKCKAGAIEISGGKVYAICGTTTSNAQYWGPGGGNPGGGPGGGGGNPGGGPGGQSSGPEAIESKGALTITGGEVYAYSSDDAINSAGDLTISGGMVCAYSTGNDGIDANGNCYIKGGIVYAIGASSPEVGIDANSEEQKKLYVSGGTLVAIGGLESGSSLTQTCKSTSSWSKNAWYALYTDGEAVLAFKTPASGGTQLVVSTSGTTTLKSGVTASGTAIFNGMGYYNPSVSGGNSVSLSNYTSSGGGWW